MPKVLPAHEVGLPEGIGRVRVSTSRARRGKILAVEHPIFGWIPYRQWALLRLVPEDRILPAVIIGISTFVVAKLAMDNAQVVVTEAIPAIGFSLFGSISRLFGIIPVGEAIGLLGKGFFPEEEVKGSIGDALKNHPLPFYIGVMAAGLTLAGLDPGQALRAFAEILNAIIPG